LSHQSTPARASKRWTTLQNGLQVNVSKSKEIAFQNSRRRIAETLPQPLPDISRENVLKILGVTITNHLSASEHIHRIISDSAQSLYALRVLRHHGMTDRSTRRLPIGRRTIASPSLPMKKNFPEKGVVRVRWPVLEFYTSCNISATANARDFKFCTWVGHAKS